MGGKFSVLTVLSGTTDAALAREISMHAAAAFPKYLNRADVPAEILEDRDLLKEWAAKAFQVALGKKVERAKKPASGNKKPRRKKS